ncbi:hypothetical protein GCM10027451_20080 [Geodermatophilus aquaeductus]|uniref:Lipoprotein n=1 Tax=Geodermatophilus aquaeductus TaxID=1564161 RepID=A0A521AYL3_9ACTN|nr:hypothetical protein [Geodermatophilus aquaeductus]SMO39600.1 hypothetical protein SAMN06273567_101428 [Geodermatophilus aquaeductus]
MRSFPSLSRSALVAAAAAVLLTACGGADGSGSEETAESTSADTSSSAAPSTGSSSAGSSSAGSSDPAVAAFCQQAAQYEELGNQLTAATPEQLPGLLQQAAAAFDSVQPPAEIASDWTVVGDAVQAFSDTANSVDITTPDGQARLQTAAQEFVTVAQGPEATNVAQFGEQNCGGAAPTS